MLLDKRVVPVAACGPPHQLEHQSCRQERGQFAVVKFYSSLKIERIVQQSATIVVDTRLTEPLGFLRCYGLRLGRCHRMPFTPSVIEAVEAWTVGRALAKQQ